MNAQHFLRLARQVLVPRDDPDAADRATVHATVDAAIAAYYDTIERDVEASWQRGEVPRMPAIKSVSELEAEAAAECCGLSSPF
jgi:hypothetical protein